MRSPADLADALSSAAQPAMDEWRVPGVALGVTSVAETSTRPLGITNIEHPLPITDQTIFQVGSISKIHTATLAMTLCEEGVLNLDDPIRRWLPDLTLRDADAAEQVTLRHLLEHTGGWFGDYAIDTGRGADALALVRPKLAAAEQATSVGEFYHYNNLGYVLIGQLIESATGEQFERLMAERIIDPADMADTAMFPERIIFKRIAAGHRVGRNNVRLASYSRPRSRVPNGGVLSSVGDVLHLARIHLRFGAADNGTRIITTETADAMRQPGAPTGVDAEHRGLGWVVGARHGLATLEHSGATAGFQTKLIVMPDEGLAVAVLANARTGGEVIRVVERTLREIMFGGELPVATEPMPEQAFAELEGVYQGSGVLQVSGTADEPILTTWMGGLLDPGQHPLAATTTEGRFEVVDGRLRGSQFDLLPGTDFLRYKGSRLFRRVTTRDQLRSLEPLARRYAAFRPELAKLRRALPD